MRLALVDLDPGGCSQQAVPLRGQPNGDLAGADHSPFYWRFGLSLGIHYLPFSADRPRQP